MISRLRKRGRGLPLWAWVMPVLILLLLGLYWGTYPVSTPGLFNITQARAFVSDSERIQSKAVSLPHVLDDEQEGWRDAVEYRIEWPSDLKNGLRPQARLAMLFPRVGTRFRVLLNQEEIYEYGWYRSPEATIFASAVPHFVPLPTQLQLNDITANEIRIEVRGQVLERSGLWPLRIGEHSVVHKRYKILEFWQVTVTWMMGLVSALVAIMSVFMWKALKERLFLLIAATSGAHMVRAVLLVLTEAPFSYELAYVLNRAMLGLHGMFFVLTIEELFGRRYPGIRKAAWLGLILTPIMLGMTVWTQEYNWTRVWAGFLTLLSLVTLAWAVVDHISRRIFTSDQALISLVAAFTLLTAIRDFAVIQLSFPGDGDIRWMSTGGIALMLAMGWILVQRSTGWARQVHKLNATLDERIKAREAELEAAYGALEQERMRQAAETERKRLMREMHDGLGSQLVQTLSYIQNTGRSIDPSTLSDMVVQALTDLRLTLDSLEQMGGDIPTILGTLRRRIGPSLKAAGIELKWEVDDVKPLQHLDARGVMHIFRCMQEIFANAVKHAGARTIRVRAFEDENGTHIVVEDDGVGMGSTPPASSTAAWACATS